MFTLPADGPPLPDAALRDARQVLAWAGATFGGDLVLASALGDASLVVLDLAREVGVDLPVVFIDTGLHFPETLEHLANVERHFDIAVERARPARSVDEQALDEGPALWNEDPDRCCALRKVAPLDLALDGRRAWVTGLVRTPSGERADTREVEWDFVRKIAKVNPLASWTRAEVMARAERRGLPKHPLRDAGYPSIGCAPCTVAVAAGGPERAGRWAGRAKTECGLHARAAEVVR